MYVIVIFKSKPLTLLLVIKLYNFKPDVDHFVENQGGDHRRSFRITQKMTCSFQKLAYI